MSELSGNTVREIIETLGFDPTNHHNAAKCPYCNPRGETFFDLASRAEEMEAALDQFHEHKGWTANYIAQGLFDRATAAESVLADKDKRIAELEQLATNRLDDNARLTNERADAVFAIDTLRQQAGGMAKMVDRLIERFEIHLPHPTDHHNGAHNKTRRLMEEGRKLLSAFRASSTGEGWMEEAQQLDRANQLLGKAWGALNFILAFYEPGQRYLDTEAWKQAEATGRRVHAEIEAYRAEVKTDAEGARGLSAGLSVFSDPALGMPRPEPVFNPLSYADACQLSRMFNRIADVRSPQYQAINERLKEWIASAPDNPDIVAGHVG